MEEPEFYVVVTGFRGGPAGVRPAMSHRPYATLTEAREVTNDGEKGGVILAAWADGTMTAVEARRTVIKAGCRARREVARYGTEFK